MSGYVWIEETSAGTVSNTDIKDNPPYAIAQTSSQGPSDEQIPQIASGMRVLRLVPRRGLENANRVCRSHEI